MTEPMRMEDAGSVALERGLRFRKVRTYDVDRQAILGPAFAKAAEAGYSFEATSKRLKVDDRLAQWRHDNRDEPTIICMRRFLARRTMWARGTESLHQVAEAAALAWRRLSGRSSRARTGPGPRGN